MPDLKITQLTEETSPVGADLMAIVDDVAGTPVTKKCTLTNLATLMGTLAPGGDSTYTSAHASPPATPGAGDLWLPTDSFYAYRYSGSVWVPWGPIFPMTPPVDGDFAWINQGSASVVTTNGGIYLSDGATNNGFHIRKKAAPATPYTITAAFLANVCHVDYMTFGLLFRQSSDGKLAFNAIQFNSGGGGFRYQSFYFTNPTTYAGDGSAPVQTPLKAIVWLRITDNGTNRIMSYSNDGQNWLTHSTLGRTAFLTADEIGFAIDPANAGYGMGVTLLSWKET